MAVPQVMEAPIDSEKHGGRHQQQAKKPIKKVHANKH